MKISKAELLKKYGIDLPVGKFAITNDGHQYTINSVKDDTLGCILVGMNAGENRISNCAPATALIMDFLEQAERNRQSSTIEIVNPKP